MKKILQVLPIIVLLVSVGFFIGLTDIQKENKVLQVSNTQVKTGTVITNNEGYIKFNKVDLFGTVANRNITNNFASKSVSLKLDKTALQNALASREKSITFTIPTGDAAPMQLELIEQKVFSENSSVYKLEGNTKTKVDYTPGLSYTGIVKGKEHSMASISIFNDFVMGVISDETGNYVLGSVLEAGQYTDNYILYNDNDLKVLHNFKCSLDGQEDKFSRSAQNNAYNQEHSADNTDMATQAVRIYFEADYKMYQDFSSSTTNVANYIQGMYNSVITIYNNESIPSAISDIGVWSSVDPYRSLTDNEQILTKFGQNKRDNFAGNFAQLISTRTDTDGGGIAWINTMCVPYQADGSGRYSFCFIDATYNNYPTYSWTVNVVAHELGHNYGSYHTHSCHWPTNFSNTGAIDSCFTAEGSCFGSTRARTGTIMSYCHLTSGGINLALGFGPLPGDTIRLRYAQATCLTGITNSSERPVVYDLKQNFPNPFKSFYNYKILSA